MSRKNPPSKISSYQNVEFLADGSPYSAQFDDIYFDTAQGFSQSETIFIDGNALLERWMDWQQPRFIIAETGFGTGLNIVLLLKAFQLWQHHPDYNDNLSIDVYSVELQPLSKNELSQALANFAGLSEYSQLLIAGYPDTLSEDTVLTFFNGKVTLHIQVGDATTRLSAMAKQQPASVNAWFLDGFSPEKNPQMWQPALYQQIGLLSAPEATLATFTVAGHVRRGLQQVGFRLAKKRSHLNKNEILVGQYQSGYLQNLGYQRRPLATKPQRVTIVGGGIASACLALQLARIGIKVTVLCKDQSVAAGASSNAIGAIYPLIHQTRDAISRFSVSAFYYAKQFYQSITTEGYDFAHNWSGLLDVAHKPQVALRQQKLAKLNNWPTRLIQHVSAETANKLAGININQSALYIPEAGWVSPVELVNQLFNAALATGNCKIKLETQVQSISQQSDDSWQLSTNKGNHRCSHIVLCAGHESTQLTGIECDDIYPVRGQVTQMQSTAKMAELKMVVCHKGYITPADQNQHCIGATFDRMQTSTTASTQDNLNNLALLQDKLPGVTDWQQSDIINGHARVRACTADHFPVAGPIANTAEHITSYAKLAEDKNWPSPTAAPVRKNGYLLTALGARGLSSAPILAAVITADLCGSPYPLPADLLFQLAPNRFVMREIIRGKYKL